MNSREKLEKLNEARKAGYKKRREASLRKKHRVRGRYGDREKTASFREKIASLKELGGERQA